MLCIRFSDHSSFDLWHAQCFIELSGGRAHIGIKRMGELDLKAFSNAWRQRPTKEGEVTATILCSKWEAQIKNPSWYPFKVVMVDGKETV